MNTNTTLSKGSWVQLNECRATRTAMLLLLLALPTGVQAQFNYSTYNGTIAITGYYGPGGAVVIPSKINGLPVDAVAPSTFQNCISVTSIAIPNSVMHIDNLAFSFAINLTAITVDAGNPAFSSLDGVLFDKSQTTLLTYPEGKAGTSYTIPGSVTSIALVGFGNCYSLTNVTIPDSVTSIQSTAFGYCTSLTSISIPNSVTNLWYTFQQCTSLTSVTIGTNVTSIGDKTFSDCTSLTSITIPNSVTHIEYGAFQNCTGLTAVYFKGNAPSGDSSAFTGDNNAIVYYLPGTTGWGTTFGGRPTVLWDPPVIRTSPQTQTAEAGSAADLRVQASGSSPLFCVWYLNYTNLLSCSTNRELALSSVQFAQSGAYTVVVSNVLGAVTSSPAMLNVIAAIERRPVPGVKVMGETGSLLDVDYADSLSAAPNWTTLGSVSLTSPSQYYFDLTLPLPPQRLYRASQAGMPGVIPSLDLHQVPAITLAGNIGGSVRLDYINQFGPIDAWVTLDTVTLTNTSQLYFDVSAPGQPPRLYRLVPFP
jgi:hypothetical protein